MLKQTKQIFFVNFNFFEDQYLRNLKKPSCVPKELNEFLFKWSLETVRQFGINILKTIPSKMYISKATELENLKQLETAEKVIKLFDIFDIKKVDKLEFICVYPFIVENNFENAFYCKKFLMTGSVEFFSFDNQDKINKEEFEMFVDTLLRAIHKIVQIEVEDDLSSQTRKQLVRLHSEPMQEIINSAFEGESAEIDHSSLFKKIKNTKFGAFLNVVNQGMNSSQKEYEYNYHDKTRMKILQEFMKDI